MKTVFSIIQYPFEIVNNTNEAICLKGPQFHSNDSALKRILHLSNNQLPGCNNEYAEYQMDGVQYTEMMYP